MFRPVSILVLLGLAAVAQAEPVPSEAVRAPEKCASVVFVDCKAPGSRADGAADEGDEAESMVITGERFRNPKSQQWLRFDEQVARAAVPSCYDFGSKLGLLAVPIVPLMAASGKCH